MAWPPSPSYSPLPLSPNRFFGAAILTLPPSPLPPPGSSPGLWWLLPSLPSPISTLDAPITPSPVYSPTTLSSWPPYSPVTPTTYYLTDATSLISPGYCPLPTAYPPTSPNYCPEEFSHGDQHAYPAPEPPLPYYNPTSQIYGNSSTAYYSPTAPGYCPARSSGGWNRTSPVAWWEPPVLQLPPSPVLSPWSAAYSPVQLNHGNPSLAHGVVDSTVREFCCCCLMPLEDCCCNKDASLAHGVDKASEYCYCCSTLLEDCCCMAGNDAPALPPLPPPA